MMGRWLSLTLLPFIGLGLSCSHSNDSAVASGDGAGEKASSRYRLFVPSKKAPTPPLLVMIHGCAQDATSFERGSQMNAQAERHGFLVLYPNQQKGRNSHNCWNWFKPENRLPNSGELKEILEMIDEVSSRQAVDRSRIYLAGLSSGSATVAALLACHSDRFAGAALHSGPAFDVADNAIAAVTVMRFGPSKLMAPRKNACTPVLKDKRLIIVQGEADPVVHPSHATKLASQFIPADATVKERTLKLESPGESAMKVSEHTQGGFTALVIRVDGMKHAWAGGKPGENFFDPKAFSASELVGRFLVSGEKPY